MGVFGAVDLGSNTVRFLVARKERGRSLEIHYSGRAISRLSEGLWREGELQPQAMERTLGVLRDFRRRLEGIYLDGFAAVATSPLRAAKNGREFGERVRQETGWTLRVASGREEARWAVLGVREALPDLPPRFVLADIGGGSTEIVAVESEEAGAVLSLDLGAVRLTEAYFSRAPVPADELERLREAIRGRLATAAPLRQRWAGAPLVGTAGTMTTLAAVDQGLEVYDSFRINGHALSRGRVGELREELQGKSAEELSRVAGLEPGRRDIIVAGAALAEELGGYFQCPGFLVSDYGVREGIVIDQFLGNHL